MTKAQQSKAAKKARKTTKAKEMPKKKKVIKKGPAKKEPKRRYRTRREIPLADALMATHSSDTVYDEMLRRSAAD